MNALTGRSRAARPGMPDRGPASSQGGQSATAKGPLVVPLLIVVLVFFVIGAGVGYLTNKPLPITSPIFSTSSSQSPAAPATTGTPAGTPVTTTTPAK